MGSLRASGGEEGTGVVRREWTFVERASCGCGCEGNTSGGGVGEPRGRRATTRDAKQDGGAVGYDVATALVGARSTSFTEAANFDAEASKKGGEGGRSVGEPQENCEGEEEISEGMLRKGKSLLVRSGIHWGGDGCYRDGKQIPCDKARCYRSGPVLINHPQLIQMMRGKQAEAEKKDLSKNELPPVVDEVLRHILSDANTNYAVWKWWSKRSEQEKDAVIAQLDQLSPGCA